MKAKGRIPDSKVAPDWWQYPRLRTGVGSRQRWLSTKQVPSPFGIATCPVNFAASPGAAALLSLGWVAGLGMVSRMAGSLICFASWTALPHNFG